MTDPIKVMTIELTEPTQDLGYRYGLKITEFDTDSPDKEKITNIVQRDYFHTTPVIVAIEDLLIFTQRSIALEEQQILDELTEAK